MNVFISADVEFYSKIELCSFLKNSKIFKTKQQQKKNTHICQVAWKIKLPRCISVNRCMICLPLWPYQYLADGTGTSGIWRSKEHIDCILTKSCERNQCTSALRSNMWRCYPSRHLQEVVVDASVPWSSKKGQLWNRYAVSLWIKSKCELGLHRHASHSLFKAIS